MGKSKILFIMFPALFIACAGGGGGDGEGDDLSAGIVVTPAAYNFGVVTPGNSAETLEVVIANNGTAGLTVEDIFLTDTDNYELNSNDCFAGPAALAPGQQCTVEVDFVRTEIGETSAKLKIQSNDPVYPRLNVGLTGSRQDIEQLHVRINQIEACPREPGEQIEAYVSVTDQGGWRVVNLKPENFFITEDGAGKGNPASVFSVKDDGSISAAALAMDYSGSITDIEDAVGDMEEAVISFIGEKGGSDAAEIIKFGSEYRVVQEFTDDAGLLVDKVEAPFDEGGSTKLYGAVVQAVQDAKAFQQENAAENDVRKAVIVVTDGDNNTGGTLDEVIREAQENDVPVFTIGIGALDAGVLEKMADETGGQYYEALTSDNLKNVYKQLADILYEGQYILAYDSDLTNEDLETGDGPTLTVEADVEGVEKRQEDEWGTHTKTIVPCPAD